MARFLVKASEFKNVCKAVNDRKLAELKKEIVEILKKQDEKEVKKAVDYFTSQELHYTHLEKSLNGKWIEKAGYGVGTVRIWKGKKYKKIAPGKWARVFEKEGRGTNIAIGKLIAKVQKIDNVEDLMAFVMQNKQRFVDENGVDLPVLDKLRAAVDAKNNGDMGSSKTNEKKTVDYSKMSEDELKELTSKLHDKLREKDYDEVDEEMEQINAISKQQAINFYKTREKHTLQHVEDVEQKKKMIADSKAVTEKELARKEKQKAKETNIAKKNKLVDEVKELKHKISAFEQIAKELDVKNESSQRLEHVISPIEFTDNHGNKIRYEIDEVKDAPEDYGNPVRVYKVEGNVRTEIAGNVKNYEDAYSAVMEQVEKTKEGTTETEKKYIDESIKTLPKEDSKGNKIEESESEKKQEVYKKEYEESIKNAVNKFAEILKEENISSKEELENLKKVQEIRIKNEKENEESDGSKGRIRIAEEKIKFIKQRIKEIEEKETEAEKTQNRSDAMKGNKNAYKGGYAPSESTNLETKKAIAENKNIGENEVQMPYSKELAAEMESLKNCVSRDSVREFMQRVYYENGNLVATDGRRIKVVKVGDLKGIDNGTYVDIDITKNGINIKKNDFEGQFPKYDKVIPDDLSQKVTLNNKVIKDKIKEMKKDGAIDKKVGRVQLEFKDGKVYLDDTEIGEAQNINLKYSDDWGPARNETNLINVNADYLVNALNGNSSILMLGERADKAMGISTDSTTNIIMPMNGSDTKMDYSEGRKAKKENDDWKLEEKKKHQDAMNNIVDTQKESMSNEWVQSLINKVNNKEMENHKTIIEHAYKALKDAEKMIEKPTKKWTSSLANNKYGYSLLAAVRKNPEFKTALENMAMEYGLIKKSLFDDFIVDVFEADDEDELEQELYEGETEYNDYSAEQPELFNSTAIKVREALDRINNQVL